MIDRELLELAAKAAGYKVAFDDGMSATFDDGIYYTIDRGYPEANRYGSKWWNPLMDDGDALRLAVKLNLHLKAHQSEGLDYVTVGIENPVRDNYLNTDESKWLADESDIEDRFAMARRAIVRASAEIGKSIP